MSDEGDQVLEEYRRFALTDIRTFSMPTGT